MRLIRRHPPRFAVGGPGFAGGVLLAALGCALLAQAPARAADIKVDIFGKRTDNPDGSTAVSVGRTVPLDFDAFNFDTKVGMDVLAPSTVTVITPDVLDHAPATRSSGAAWVSTTLPKLATPYGWDKAALDLRIDPFGERAKLATTLGRTLPVGHFAFVVASRYAVVQPLPAGAALDTGPAASPLAPAFASPANTAATSLETGDTLRFNVLPTGTSLAADVALSSLDNRPHATLSAEQTIGAINLRTALSNLEADSATKTITAGFKRSW